MLTEQFCLPQQATKGTIRLALCRRQGKQRAAGDRWSASQPCEGAVLTEPSSQDSKRDHGLCTATCPLRSHQTWDSRRPKDRQVGRLRRAHRPTAAASLRIFPTSLVQLICSFCPRVDKESPSPLKIPAV